MLMCVPSYVDGAVLRENGDAAFPLEIVRVHDAVDDVLVRGERARLAQQLVDERGLAVVDVGDDRDVAKGTGHGENQNFAKPSSVPRRHDEPDS